MTSSPPRALEPLSRGSAGCPACGGSLRPGAGFCPRCGLNLSEVCPHCQHRLVPGANFCDRCGRPLSARSLLAAAAFMPPPGGGTGLDLEGEVAVSGARLLLEKAREVQGGVESGVTRRLGRRGRRLLTAFYLGVCVTLLVVLATIGKVVFFLSLPVLVMAALIVTALRFWKEERGT